MATFNWMAPEQLLLLRDELIRDEGIRLKFYFDSVGVPTIGVGRNLRDRGITFEEASYLLMNDIKAVQSALAKDLTWYLRLDPVRRRVLENLGFNVGPAGLLGFRKMLAACEAGDYEQAAIEMLDSKWATQVGARAQRLAVMMRTGAIG